jgi:hypothetical protein
MIKKYRMTSYPYRDNKTVYVLPLRTEFYFRVSRAKQRFLELSKEPAQ